VILEVRGWVMPCRESIYEQKTNDEKQVARAIFVFFLIGGHLIIYLYKRASERRNNF